MVRALFPASFNPVHNGHVDIAERAASIFDEVVVAVYDRPQKKIFFDLDQRVSMVKRAMGHIDNITVVSYSTLTVNFAQEIGAKVIVRGLRVFSDFEFEFRMALANKRMAPEIEMLCLMASESHMHIASSTVLEIATLAGDVSSMVPATVNDAILAHFSKISDDAPEG